MLSVKIFTSSDAAGKYYSHGDYYGSEGEGVWFGRGAKDFDLQGNFTVKNNRQFYDLLNGITPTGEKIGRKTKEGIEHNPGTDLTFSVPKSFSLQMMLYATVAQRKDMETAVMSAVKNTLTHIEKEGYIFARIGHNGRVKEDLTKLTFAAFMHTTNRNLEPQVHVHSFLANIAKCSDGKYRSINVDHLLENNKLFGQIFRNELAIETKKLGHEIAPTVLSDGSTSFELANINPKMIEAFSTRRKEILELCKKYGVTTKEGRDRIVINSRKAKKHVAYDNLVKAWNELEQKIQKDIKNEKIAEPNFNNNISVFDRLFNLSDRNNEEDKRQNEILTTKDLAMMAIENVSYRKSVFSESELLKNALKYSLGSYGILEIKAELRDLEKTGTLIRNQDQFTTKELLTKEKQILKYTENSLASGKVIIKKEAVDYQCKRFEAREIAKNKDFMVNKGQIKAIKHILTSKDKIITMEGLPGVGKSTVLNAVRDISGRKVINLLGSPFGFGEKFEGSAPTASASNTLQSSAKVESQTLHSFITKYQGYIENRGSKGSLNHFKQEYKNIVIFVDEASLISTNVMHKLLTLQEKFGFRLVMTGDTKQLGSVEAGKPFEQMIVIIKPVKLSAIVRQKDEAHREAIVKVSEGKIADSFLIHDRNIKASLSIADDTVSSYLNKSSNQRENTLLISPTRVLRDEINNKIVQGLKLPSKKHEFTALRQKDMNKADLNFAHFYNQGDVIRFNSKYNGINKGDYLKVKLVNKITNSLILESRNYNNNDKSKNIILNLRHKTDYSNKLAVFQEKNLQLQEGLKIIFTKNNKDFGLINSETAAIEKIGKSHIALKFEDGHSRSVPIEQLRHVDYGYCITVHAAQGKTFNHTIAAIDNNKYLNNQKMWLVAVSRHRSDFTVLVDDRERLQNQISRNHGRENSATSLETTPIVKESNHNVPEFKQSTNTRSLIKEMESGY